MKALATGLTLVFISSCAGTGSKRAVGEDLVQSSFSLQELRNSQNRGPILTAILEEDFETATTYLQNPNLPDESKDYFHFLIKQRKKEIDLEDETYMENLLKSLTKKPNRFIEQFVLAHLVSQGQNEKAAATIRKLVERSRGQSHWPAWMGLVYLMEGNLARARYQFKRAISLGGDQFMAWYGLGAAAEREQKYEKATQFYKKALLLQPWSGVIHRRMALIMINEGNRKQALYHIDAVSHLMPQRRDEVYYLLGRLAFAADEWQVALERFKKAREERRSHVGALIFAARILARQPGRRDDALELIGEAAQFERRPQQREVIKKWYASVEKMRKITEFE